MVVSDKKADDRRTDGCVAGVGLCVDRGDAVARFHHVAYVGTVWHTANGAVVARGENGSIAHDDRTDIFALACRSRGHHVCDVHEIPIPGYTGSDGFTFTHGLGS